MRLSRTLTAVATSLALAGSTLLVTVVPASADEAPQVTNVMPATVSPGQSGHEVRRVQGMLFRIGLLTLSQRTGSYDATTTAAVKKFQSSKSLGATGIVDDKTDAALTAAYRATPAGTVQQKKVVRKVAGPIPKPKPKPAPVSDVKKYGLDPRCDDEAKVICADQSRRKVWYLENGKVVKQFDGRFGASSTPTRNGSWRIFSKVRDEWSYLYNVKMPFAMYFSGGEAFHYSADFAQIGWNNSRGGSHGCINIRDYEGMKYLFDRAPVGTLAVVYP